MKDTDTRTFFDANADDYYRRNYENPTTRHAFNLSLRRAVCLELFGSVDGPILDLGCGPGAMTFPLLEAGNRVISVDVSSEMLAQVNRRAKERGLIARTVAADALSLPFRDGTFSGVVTTGVLEYIPDLHAALREIHRVLTDDAIVVATMTLPRRLERAAATVLARLRGVSTRTDQFICDRPTFDRAIATAGFAVEDSRCCGFSPFPLDALVPRSVPWIDRALGPMLHRFELAKEHAKTYVVRARRG